VATNNKNIYKIVITGHKKEIDVNLVLNNLATLLKHDIEIIRPLLASKNFVIKRSLDIDTANKYQKFLENLGCIVVIESELHFDLPESTQKKPSTEEKLLSIDETNDIKVANERQSHYKFRLNTKQKVGIIAFLFTTVFIYLFIYLFNC
jgi:hypothetical protein